jgi:hypothetical protein
MNQYPAGLVKKFSQDTLIIFPVPNSLSEI